MNVAMLGLGAMGMPMATRLASAFRVTAFDVDANRLQLAEASGINATASATDAMADADVVVVAVRTLAQAEEVLLGDGMTAGAVVVLTSTIGREGCVLLGERLATRGLRLLDAPVSGGPARAGDGDLLMFLGGDEVVRAAAAPVVDALASTVVVVGERAGDGQAMKTVNQLLCGVHVAAAAEALALADALGLDPAVCVDVLGAGAAASFMLAHRGPRIVSALAGAEPEVMSRLDIFVKDLGLVEEAARSAGLATPVAAAAYQLFRLADSTGFGTKDDSVLARLLGPRERQKESKQA
jgi:3-hydroxyisobutyrate dehydrogenase